MRKEPEHECGRTMANQVVEDQEHTQGWQLLGERNRLRQILLPVAPKRRGHGGTLLRIGRCIRHRWRRKAVENEHELLFEPRVQDCIRRTGNAFHAHVTIRRMK